MKFTKDFIETLKQNSPIDLIAQEKMLETGHSFSAKGGGIFCHHHIWKTDPNPGEALYITTHDQRWYCFSCKQGGDVISLVQSFMFGEEYDNRNYGQFAKAVNALSERAGIQCEDEGELDIDYQETRILYQLYADFIEYCIKNTDHRMPNQLIEMVQNLYPLSEDTIKKFKITYFDKDWTKPFYDKLREKYTKNELIGSGLFKEYKGEIQATFQNRILIPYFQYGDIVDVIGRQTVHSGNSSELDDGSIKQFNYDGGGKFKKLPVYSEEKHPDISPHRKQNGIFGVDSLKRGKDLIITEGIGDCIVLLQEGFNAISPVTTSFKNEMLEPVSRKLSSVRQVYIANDNEVSEAGRQGSERMYNFFATKGIDARIVVLPRPEGCPKVDVASFFASTENAINEFKELLSTAKSFIEFDIEKLNPDSNKYDVQLVWDKIINLSPFDKDTYQEKLAKQIGKTITKLQKMFRDRKISSDTEETMVFEVENPIIPALDFRVDPLTHTRSVYTTVIIPVETMDDNKKVLLDRFFLLQTDTTIDGKQTFHKPRDMEKDPLTPIEMKRMPDPYIVSNRWHLSKKYPFGLENFLAGNPPTRVSAESIFLRIYNLFDTYFWYQRQKDEILIQTLYIFLTYFFQMFHAVPLMYLSGPKNSGKTNAVKLSRYLSFNSTVVINPTDSFIFRSVHNTRTTLFIDETEELNPNSNSEKWANIKTLLRARYKEGSTVPRNEKVVDTFMPTYFDVFGTTYISCISNIEDALQSRTINIECLTKEADIMLPDFTKNEEKIKLECELIRDELYFLLMTEYHNIMRIKDMLIDDPRLSKIVNREGEKWFPLFVIAQYIDSISKNTTVKIFDELIEIQKHKEKIRRQAEISNNEIIRVLNTIKDMLIQPMNSQNLKRMQLDTSNPKQMTIQVDAFYQHINKRMQDANYLKHFETNYRSYYENILRKTQVWRIDEGLADDKSMIMIDIERLESAINRLQSG